MTAGSHIPQDLNGFLLSEKSENLWGSAKRLRFARSSISETFPGRMPASIRVLDVGCGNGSHLAVPLGKLGFDVTGVDPHRPSIEEARKLAHGFPNLRFICGTVQDAPGPPFDVVILSEVLEHIEEPLTVLRCAVQQLQANGMVMVTVPNGHGEFEIDWWIFRTLRLPAVADFVRRHRGPKTQNGNDPASLGGTENKECGHVQFFTQRSLQRLFGECSLEVTRAAPAVLACGPFIGYTLGRSRRFIRWNARITDRLPLAIASGWYFTLRLAKNSDAPDG